MQSPISHPISHPIYTEGICERCQQRTSVRAIQGDDGVEHVCERCHPPESTETTEGAT